MRIVKQVVDSVTSLDDFIELERAYFSRDYDKIREITGLSKNCPILKVVNEALDELEEKFELTGESDESR